MISLLQDMTWVWSMQIMIGCPKILIWRTWRNWLYFGSQFYSQLLKEVSWSISRGFSSVFRCRAANYLTPLLKKAPNWNGHMFVFWCIEWSDDTCPYSCAVGSLVHVIHFSPDIAFIVGLISRYQSNPWMSYWNAFKCILHYLRSINDYVLCC